MSELFEDFDAGCGMDAPIPADHTRCSKCREIKSIDQFYRRKDRRCGHTSSCKACRHTEIAKYHLENKEKVRVRRAKYLMENLAKLRVSRANRKLKKRYGITLFDYNSMLSDQNGRCAICGNNTPGGNRTRFSVDHDHVSGKVRELLCSHCNTMLGRARDDPRIFDAGAKYLRKHQETAV